MNYEEIVKMAYEDIVGGFEKEASTAFDRWVSSGIHNKEDFIDKARVGSGHFSAPGLRSAIAQSARNSAVGKTIGKAMRKPSELGKELLVDIGKGLPKYRGTAADHLNSVLGKNENIRKDFHHGNWVAKPATLEDIKLRAADKLKNTRDFYDVLNKKK